MVDRAVPLFVAIFPPEDVKATLAQLSARSADQARWITPDYLHITLRFFGDAPRSPIIERLTNLELSASSVRIGPATSPWGPRTFVLPVHGVDHLSAQISQGTSDLGLAPQEDFFAHLAVAQSDNTLEPLTGIPLELDFEATTVTLIDSDWSTFPPRYTNIGEFAVRPPRGRGS